MNSTSFKALRVGKCKRLLGGKKAAVPSPKLKESTNTSNTLGIVRATQLKQFGEEEAYVIKG